MAYETIPPSPGATADDVVRDQTTGIPGPWVAIAVAGAAATDITISGLTGETDGGYELYVDILGATATPVITLQPNGLATNQSGVTSYNNGVSVAPSVITTLQLGFCGRTDAARIRGSVTLTSKTGVQREMIAQTHTGVGTGIGSEQLFTTQATWKEAVTAITSLVVHSATADGIAIGSQVWWRKLYRPG